MSAVRTSSTKHDDGRQLWQTHKLFVYLDLSDSVDICAWKVRPPHNWQIITWLVYHVYKGILPVVLPRLVHAERVIAENSLFLFARIYYRSWRQRWFYVGMTSSDVIPTWSQRCLYFSSVLYNVDYVCRWLDRLYRHNFPTMKQHHNTTVPSKPFCSIFIKNDKWRYHG